MRPSLAEINLLDLDKEGVGRSNLGKSVKQAVFPTLEKNAAGVHPPESGRTDIHPSVISVAEKRHGSDIAGWPVQVLTPEMVNALTIVIVYCDPKLIPDFVLEQAFDVLLAPIQDPFGNLESKLENTATQIAFFNWLLYVTLTSRFDEIGTHRDENGYVIPRYLVQFEPKNIEPEYSFDGFTA
ncbi:MAG: hypothetical protein GW762_02550 [Candidatus Pacebacteria bacterium]|nr:hypothetical protein [Candidatus Paceibacterota bacterium]PIR64115.1 MAG: hypothetical protein COU64_01040 [Candidatus Pacebacteria bacterium CG10_big_fil_rev_8_21_14_0_10_40_26]PIZ78467.1 MAG: hypothetical protein COY01_04420 [Candidatus Pacebacteria bacterium CG_4_10_14_0_2_um_filter_40_20]PJA69317.1 MAG: hypothetical protein CO156_00305 [Candidatus Pacebacteria bacterium CG_4_9_14_3_um_filter_40_12]PJC42000.1 MAG: hypothetical protein CO041_01860 [Candidatus Pacebacteria bacterium CG_4_9_